MFGVCFAVLRRARLRRVSDPVDQAALGGPGVALCSLVKKDAGMLDAFGKGASEDIQLAKSELYSQMTWDKESKSSLGAELQATTPLPSPPPSPKPRKASAEDIGELPHSYTSAHWAGTGTRDGGHVCRDCSIDLIQPLLSPSLH